MPPSARWNLNKTKRKGPMIIKTAYDSATDLSDSNIRLK